MVWAALAVQAAIIGHRQNTITTKLRQEIAAVKAGAPASAEALPVQASDQAKAQVYDASLPPAAANPVKDITLTATETTVVGVARGVNFQGWSFGGSIPARPLHVRQGDTVNFTLINNGSMGHSMDFHAAQIDPGQNYKTVLPGRSFTFSWKAEVPGVFLFHCGTAPVIEHLANGMYGAIIVDPATPLPPAREYVLVQSEFYMKQNGSVYVGDMSKMMADSADDVVFNGMVNQYQLHPLLANPGELIRLYVVDAGPSHSSAFHVIGAIFSGVYPDGNLANKLTGVSTYNIAPGGAAMFELTIPEAGTYPFVTHAFADASRGAIGVIQVGTPATAATEPHTMPTPTATMPTMAMPLGGAATAAAPANAAQVGLSATENRFSQPQLTAKVGKPMTVTFTNKGSAIHNFHIKGQRAPAATRCRPRCLAATKRPL